jgi:hypothetical protein
MNFKLNTPLTEAFDELDKLSEEINTDEDPYGYGPYKTPEDPTLKVGDYIKAKRNPREDTWYPALVTEVTPDIVHYTISGWGFTKDGMALRTEKAERNLDKLIRSLHLHESVLEDGIDDYLDEKTARVIADLLNKTGDFVIDYKGFDVDYDEDHWSYTSSSHYQITKTVYYDDFEYEVDVGDIWEDLVTISQQDIDKYKVNQSAEYSELLNTFVNLLKETETAPKDQLASYCTKLGIFVAENLDKLFKIFYKYFYDKYEEYAQEYAIQYLEPEDPDELYWD